MAKKDKTIQEACQDFTNALKGLVISIGDIIKEHPIKWIAILFISYALIYLLVSAR